jgi:hypothetical protein
LTPFPWPQGSIGGSNGGSVTRHLPSLLAGFLGLVSPLSNATMVMLRLPLSFSCAFAFRSALDPSVLFLFSSLGDRKFAPEPGSCSTGLIPSGLPFRGDRRLSQLPRRPQGCFALLFDPGRTSTPDRRGASVLPPLRKPRRLPRSIFFPGSITPLCSSLPTLEGIISDCQPRLACGGWSLLAARALSRRVSVEAFFCSWSHSFLLSVLCLLLRAPSRLSGLWLAPLR